MRIKWYGTASLLVESGETRLLFDPYLKSENPELPPVDVKEARTASAIFISHPHLDHFSDVEAFLGGSVEKVFVSENGIAQAWKNGMDTSRMTAIKAGEAYKIGAFTVRTYQGKHIRFSLGIYLGIIFSTRTYRRLRQCIRLLKMRGKFRATDDVYAFEVTDGEMRVFILGSAGMEKHTEYPEGFDMLVLPYQGRNRMHRYIKPFLKRLAPKKVFANHFDDAFPPLSRTEKLDKFESAVKNTLPASEAVIPKEGEWYEV